MEGLFNVWGFTGVPKGVLSWASFNEKLRGEGESFPWCGFRELGEQLQVIGFSSYCEGFKRSERDVCISQAGLGSDEKIGDWFGLSEEEI